MKFILKKIMIIPAVIIAAVPVLIIGLLLLLSIFFPNELVRKELETRGTEILGSRLTIDSLSFSIFKGLVLTDVVLKQKGRGWHYDTLLSVSAIRLEYRLLPLLTRTVSVKSCVIENGVINLEQTRKKANWSHLLDLVKADDKKKTNSKEEKSPKEIKNNEKSEFSRTAFPVDFQIGKVGLDGLTVNYRNTKLLAAPVDVSLDNFTLIGKGITLKKDKPARIKISADAAIKAGKYLNLEAGAEINATVKLFSPGSDKFSLNGPVKCKVTHGKFSSKETGKLIVSLFEQIISETVGPQLKEAISDPALLVDRADSYFNGLLEKSDTTIREKLDKAEELLAWKDKMVAHKRKELDSYTSRLNGSINEIDSKISEIDSRIGPILSAASNIPFVEQFANINQYRTKMNTIRKNARAQKDKLLADSRNQLDSLMQKRISDAFPSQIPDYNSVQKQFTKTISGYKKNLAGNLQKMKTIDLARQFMPDMTFLEKDVEIQLLKTTYVLGKKSKADDLVWKTDYFTISGNVNMDGKKMDGIVNMTTNLGILGLSFLPDKKIDASANIKGTVPKLKVELTGAPELDLSGTDPAELAAIVIDSLLENRYSSNRIIGSVMRGVPTDAVDIDLLKKQLKSDQDISFKQFLNDRQALSASIEKQTSSLINEIRSSIPGL